MRSNLCAAFVALIAAFAITGCTSTSNSSTNVTTDAAASPADNSAASSDNSAMGSDNTATSSATSSSDNGGAMTSNAGGGAAVPVYPGAVETAMPASAGTPPPGGKSYTTSDPVTKVNAWYKAHLKGAKVQGETPQGGAFLIGDEKTGTMLMVMAQGGKTWIMSGPANDMK